MLGVLGALVIVLLFTHNFSYTRALNRAGFNGNHIEWVWESIDLNGNDLAIVVTEDSDGTPVIVQLERANLWTIEGWRGWRIPISSFVAYPEPDGRIRWGWIGDRYQGENPAFDANPWIANRWLGSSHFLLLGDDALGPIDFIVDQLPRGVTATVNQVGSRWILHLMYRPGWEGVTDSTRVEREMQQLGLIPVSPLIPQ